MLYAAMKAYQQQKLPPQDKSDEVVKPQKMTGLRAEIDQAYQQFVQQKIDPLLVGSAARHKQLTSLNDENTLTPLSEQEKTTNRFIALSAASIGVATLGTFLYPPLMIPAMAMGMCLLFPMYKATFDEIFQEGKIKLSLLGSLYLSGFWLAGYYIFASFAFFLYFLGLKVVYQMEGRSRQNLKNLFAQQPRVVWQLVDDIEIQTPFEQLQPGDIVVVNAGEPLPVDGLIIRGLGSVDQHMLTGESQPVEKEVGDTVFSSTLLLSGRLFIRVEKTGKNTLSAQIVEILNQTANYHSDVEMKGVALADKTVLPNLALSLLALPLLGLRSAVAVLGAGVGFNISLISLLSTMNYLSIASHHNILIKDGKVLDRLKAIDTIVFDKTGTLTLEQPHVMQVHVIESDLTENALLVYAATAEYRQPHPVAQAILAEAKRRNLALMTIDEANYEVGYGIKVRIKDKQIRVGSSRFINQEGLTIPTQMEALINRCQTQGFALILVAIDDRVVGALELHATLRPEAKRVIAELRKRNLSLAIISGDQSEPTQKLATELGIDNYFANTLPENKAQIIAQLQQQGRVVCFIGDGINDAIALKQADVSISLKGATTIATDTAQVVLMDKTLNQLDTLMHLGDRYNATLRTGLLTTIIPGVICIGGVFFAGFGIYTAEILFQLGFFSGLGVAMRPLLSKENNNDNTDKKLLK